MNTICAEHRSEYRCFKNGVVLGFYSNDFLVYTVRTDEYECRVGGEHIYSGFGQRDHQPSEHDRNVAIPIHV